MHPHMPKSNGPVVVIGSINMDLVCRTQRLPAAGETILGRDFMTVPGGKGANQAVAAAKLASTGTAVYLVGRVGGDDFGQRLLNGLNQHDVNTQFVTITEASSSGVAMILVDRAGENSIIVAPGANARLSPADVDAARSVIATASAVVLQLEIPLETVRHAIAVCQQMGVYTILDPSPVPPRGAPRAVLGVDMLVPNQTEAQALAGGDSRPSRVRRKGVGDPKLIAMNLLMRGPRAVVLKLGPKGAMMVDRSGDIE